MIHIACVGLFVLAHVAAISFLLTKMTGSGDQSDSPFKSIVAGSLAVVHVAIETGWCLVLGFATILGAAMATNPLDHTTLTLQLMTHIAIPIFGVTIPVVYILGRATKSFKLDGRAAIAVTSALIAVDLAFNAGAAIAANSMFSYARL